MCLNSRQESATRLSTLAASRSDLAGCTGEIDDGGSGEGGNDSKGEGDDPEDEDGEIDGADETYIVVTNLRSVVNIDCKFAKSCL